MRTLPEGDPLPEAASPLPAVMIWSMGLLLAAYVAGLSVHGNGFSLVVDGWLGTLTQWVPALVCWAAVLRSGRPQWDVVLCAFAVTCYAAGNTFFVLAVVAGGVVAGGAVPFPSLADVGYLLFYPPMLGALAIFVRRNLRGLGWSVWLDSALGSLGAAAALAVVLGPVMGPAMGGAFSLTMVVAVAYPLFDLLLVGAVIAIVAVLGRRASRTWLLFGAGLGIFAAADVVYALRVAEDAYRVGTPLDAGWAVGLTLMAGAVVTQPRGSGPVDQEALAAHAPSGPLAMPALATTAALGVLIAGTQVPVSALALSLAAVTLLAAAVRTQVAFGQLRRMAHLRREASTDDLTGLPNRRALYDEAASRLAGDKHPRQALLLFDLDKFKEVNDSLGHHVGDLLLIHVATRLREQLRPHDLVARLGGDEFAVLLADADHGQSVAVATKLRKTLGEPVVMEGITLHTEVSIGIALFPDHGRHLSPLLRRADIAMYKAKTAHSGHQVFTAAYENHGNDRLRTLHELRAALTDDQLVLHYQPKIDLRTDDICGVEALVRWDHPTRGLLYPGDFLSLVEEAGLMRDMTQVVLDKALHQAAIWQAEGQPLTVAVNVSASSLVDADLPEQLAALLRARGLPATALQLEITESFLMADRDRARSILARLQEQGIQVAIDDFGTGYSSLAYLRDLPIDELKLDRSFIFPMADDASAAALVASTIALAHSLGLRMVAEGVENSVAYTELARYGCDQAQGFHMSRPVPAAELDHWIATRRSSQNLDSRRPEGSAPID